MKKNLVSILCVLFIISPVFAQVKSNTIISQKTTEEEICQVKVDTFYAKNHSDIAMFSRCWQSRDMGCIVEMEKKGRIIQFKKNKRADLVNIDYFERDGTFQVRIFGTTQEVWVSSEFVTEKCLMDLFRAMGIRDRKRLYGY